MRTSTRRIAAGLRAAALICAAAVTLGTADAAGANKPLAKNVILLISDGMGFPHVDAADFYQYGAAGTQPYERFPYRAAMSTYPGSTSSTPDPALTSPGSYDPAAAWAAFPYVMMNPTDSAAAATTMATGVKTYNNAIGVDVAGNPLVNIVQLAEAAGKATGVVSSVEFSHATPAGFVAHNLSRNNYAAIAQEMILASAVDVIMGAGHPWFDNSGLPKTAPNSFQYVGGSATWDALVAGTAGADADNDGDADPWSLVQTRAEFRALAQGPTPARVIGVPQVYTTLQQARAGAANAAPYVAPLTPTVPTLPEMTAAALNVLDEDPDGFFLMVEGGAVDWAAHANQSGRMIEEQVDFNRAVQTVLAWVRRNSNWGETLVIVTGDHETGYLSGPGSNPAWEPVLNAGAGALPGLAWFSTNHTNSLIPIYAKGDAARLFTREDNGIDPVRGRYLDNTAIGRVIKAAIE